MNGMTEHDKGWAGRSVEHTVSDALLMDYAVGSTDTATNALIASQILTSPELDGRLAVMDDLGGAILQGQTAESADHTLDDAFDALMSRIDSKAADDSSEAVPGDMSQVASSSLPEDLENLPQPILDLLHSSSGQQIQWKTVLPGVSIIELDWLAGDSRARLLKVKAGTAMPHHTHEGRELTLICKGAYADETGRYAAGDVAEHDEDDHVDHQPIAEMGEDCICFAVTTAPLRLTGAFGRFLNPFVDI
ncbi:MAG: ChrR family anti-sigma-E factor [Alphaproteobacteria bacterium]